MSESGGFRGLGSGDSSRLEERVSRIESVLNRILQSMEGQGSRPESAGQGGEEARLSDKDIDTIADALDEMGKKLSLEQRAYVLGIFGSAFHAAEQNMGREGREEDSRVVRVTNAAALDKVKLSDAFTSLTRVQPGRLGQMGPGVAADSVGGGVSVTCVHGDWTRQTGGAMDGQWRTNPAFGDRQQLGGRLTQPGGGLAQPGGFRNLPGGFGR